MAYDDDLTDPWANSAGDDDLSDPWDTSTTSELSDPWDTSSDTLTDPWDTSSPIDEPDEPLDKSAEFSDYLKVGARGGAHIGSGVGWVAERAGFDEAGKAISDVSSRAAEYWSDSLSEGAKAQMEKTFVEKDDDPSSLTGYKLGDFTLETVGLSGAESILGTAAGMGAGFFLTKGLSLLPFVSQRVAATLGYSLGEAGVAAPSAGAQAEEEVAALTDDELGEHPEFKALLAMGETVESARYLTKKAAGGASAFVTLVSTAVLSAPFGNMLDNIIDPKVLKGTMGGRALKGGITEGIQEFFQSGAEQASVNASIKFYADQRRELGEGVPNAAVGGSLAGFTMGAGFGAAANPSGRSDAPGPSTADTRHIDDVMAAGDIDSAIEAADSGVGGENQSPPPGTMEPFDPLKQIGEGIPVGDPDEALEDGYPPEAYPLFDAATNDLMEARRELAIGQELANEGERLLDEGDIDGASELFEQHEAAGRKVREAEMAVEAAKNRYEKEEVISSEQITKPVDVAETPIEQTQDDLGVPEDTQPDYSENVEYPSGREQLEADRQKEMIGQVDEIQKRRNKLEKETTKSIPRDMELFNAIRSYGGVDLESARSEGLDITARDTKQGGKNRVFKKGGKSLDDMAEALSQDGFFGEGEVTPNALLDMIDRRQGGENIYSPQSEAGAEYQGLEQEQDQIRQDMDSLATSLDEDIANPPLDSEYTNASQEEIDLAGTVMEAEVAGIPGEAIDEILELSNSDTAATTKLREFINHAQGQTEKGQGPVAGLEDEGAPRQAEAGETILSFPAEETPDPIKLPGDSAVAQENQAIKSEAQEAASSPQNDLKEPSDPQIEANNYKKGHPVVQGMNISIENPKGSTRSGTDDQGKAWENHMGADYGDLLGTEGADGDPLDVFIGENPAGSDKVFVIDQQKKNGSKGGFDEHKIMLGFDTQREAAQAYLGSYDAGWRLGPVTEITIDELKAWVESADTTKEFSSNFEENFNNPMPPKDFDLTPQTQEEIEAQEATRTAQEAEKPPAEVESPDDFVMTGSTSAVDQAEARGQDNLFDQPVSEAPEHQAIVPGEVADPDKIFEPAWPEGISQVQIDEAAEIGVDLLPVDPEDWFSIVDRGDLFKQPQRGEYRSVRAQGKNEAKQLKAPEITKISDTEWEMLADPALRAAYIQSAKDYGSEADLEETEKGLAKVFKVTITKLTDRSYKVHANYNSRYNQESVTGWEAWLNKDKRKAPELTKEVVITKKRGRKIDPNNKSKDAPRYTPEQVAWVDAQRWAKGYWLEIHSQMMFRDVLIDKAIDQRQDPAIDNSNKLIFSLFDYTGQWSAPWADAGYNVVAMDIQKGTTEEEAIAEGLFDPNDMDQDFYGEDAPWWQNPMDVRDFARNPVRWLETNGYDSFEVYGILAACPCTDFTNSGNRHKEQKKQDGRLAASKELVFSTLELIEYLDPRLWVIENPVGEIQDMTGLPNKRMLFDPAAYGDPYTKATALWGKFDNNLPEYHVEPAMGSKFFLDGGGGSIDTKNFRSETPTGFAAAFFAANNHMEIPAAERLERELPYAAGAIRAAVDAGFSERIIRKAINEANDEDEGEAFDIWDESYADNAREGLLALINEGTPVAEIEQGEAIAEAIANDDVELAAELGLDDARAWLQERFSNQLIPDLVAAQVNAGIAKDGATPMEFVDAFQNLDIDGNGDVEAADLMMAALHVRSIARKEKREVAENESELTGSAGTSGEISPSDSRQAFDEAEAALRKKAGHKRGKLKKRRGQKVAFELAGKNLRKAFTEIENDGLMGTHYPVYVKGIEISLADPADPKGSVSIAGFTSPMGAITYFATYKGKDIKNAAGWLGGTVQKLPSWASKQLSDGGYETYHGYFSMDKRSDPVIKLEYGRDVEITPEGKEITTFPGLERLEIAKKKMPDRLVWFGAPEPDVVGIDVGKAEYAELGTGVAWGEVIEGYAQKIEELGDPVFAETLRSYKQVEKIPHTTRGRSLVAKVARAELERLERISSKTDAENREFDLEQQVAENMAKQDTLDYEPADSDAYYKAYHPVSQRKQIELARELSKLGIDTEGYSKEKLVQATLIMREAVTEVSKYGSWKQWNDAVGVNTDKAYLKRLLTWATLLKPKSAKNQSVISTYHTTGIVQGALNGYGDIDMPRYTDAETAEKEASDKAILEEAGRENERLADAKAKAEEWLAPEKGQIIVGWWADASKEHRQILLSALGFKNDKRLEKWSKAKQWAATTVDGKKKMGLPSEVLVTAQQYIGTFWDEFVTDPAAFAGNHTMPEDTFSLSGSLEQYEKIIQAQEQSLLVNELRGQADGISETLYMDEYKQYAFKAPDGAPWPKGSPQDLYTGSYTETKNGRRISVQLERTEYPAIGEWSYSVTDAGGKISKTKPAESFEDAVLKARAVVAPKVKGDSTEKTDANPPKAKRTADYGTKNKVVSKDKASEAIARIKARQTRLKSGLDPEDAVDAVIVATFHIEAGVRKFSEFSAAMLEDLGESMRPYLRQFYENVRWNPDMAGVAAELDDNETIAAYEEQADVERTAGDQEPDRAGGQVPDTEADTGDAGRGTVGSEADGAGEEAGGEQRDDTAGVGEPGADLFGEPSGKPSYSEKSELAESAAGGLNTGGGSVTSTGGLLADQETDRVADNLIEKTPATISIESIPEPMDESLSNEERDLIVSLLETMTDMEETTVTDEVIAATIELEVEASGEDEATVKPYMDDLLAKMAKDQGVEIEEISAPEPLGPVQQVKNEMPFLTDGQAEDVVFAEKRFTNPEGIGVLFTNGTGTGKTFSAMGVVKRMVDQGKDNILIATPKQTINDAWIKAAEKFFGLDIHLLTDKQDTGKGVTITTYSNLGDNPTLIDRDWDAFVADESHYLSSSQSGKSTRPLSALRALTYLRGTEWKRADMRHPQLAAERDALLQIKIRNKDESARLNEIHEVLRITAKEESGIIEAKKNTDKPRNIFLSATPFAYEKSVTWANEFLFDWGVVDRNKTQGYNETDPYEDFMQTHFGYRMRYNKLTAPEAEVDSGLMQRQFNTWLKKQGALSFRGLDSEYDYDRKFVMLENAIGKEVDEALQWIRDQHGEKGPNRLGGIKELNDAVKDSFDYHSRMYFLEALKARDAIPMLKAHLELGRKIVVIHDFKKGGVTNPFRVREQNNTEAFKAFREKFSKLIDNFDYVPSVIETLSGAFPDALVYNGDVSGKKRVKMQDEFNDDSPGSPRIIIAQGDAMREGVSVHDTTGKHQRVSHNLGLPVRPFASIQLEGRTYRTGQASNAMNRYQTMNTNWERVAFATTIAGRADVADNLAMGESARGLKQLFIDAYEEADTYWPGFEGEGTGGKALEAEYSSVLTEWDSAKSFYFGTKKQGSGRSSRGREQSEFFATPEPLGMKMVQWADMRGDESALEPSAGHGAIGRFFPENAKNTAIELTDELSSKLSLHFNGTVITGDFSDHSKVNKYHSIVMNPPFGAGGAQARDHVKKAMEHLREGGRIVALIPMGPAADKKFDTLMESEEAKNFHTVGDIALPAVTFERAGTKVMTRVLILERQDNPEVADQLEQRNPDFRDVDTIGDFFDRIEDTDMGTRLEPVPVAKKGRRPAATQQPARPSFLEADDIDSLEPVVQEIEANMGFNAMDSEHTKTGAPLYVVNFTIDMGDNYDQYKAAATNNRGRYIPARMRNYYKPVDGSEKRGKPTFTFDSPGDRAAFMQDIVNIGQFSETPEGWHHIDPGGPTGAQTGKPLGIAKTKKAIAKVVKSLNQELDENVIVVGDITDMGQHVQNMSKRGKKDSTGVYYNGGVYLFANNIYSARDARINLAHELVGHKGVQEMSTPDEWDEITSTVGNLIKNGSTRAESIATEVLERYGKTTEQDKFYKEFIAVAAERRVKTGRIGQLLAKVKEILRRWAKLYGFNPFADSELDIILANAGKYLKISGKAEQQAGMTETLFSRIAAAAKLNEEEIAEWRSINKVSQRRGRVEEVQIAAEGLAAGDMPVDMYNKMVEHFMPIMPIQEVPELTTTQEISAAVTPKARENILGVDTAIDAGTRVASRLDIPAYDFYDTWVVTVHDGSKRGGKAIAYSGHAVMDNVEFVTNAKAALGIATGEAAKAPFARIHGDWVQMEPQEAQDMAKTAISGEEWTQVGMNPFRHSYFYDKATGAPVVSAQQVVQVGPLVMAKGVEYASVNDERFRVGKSDVFFADQIAPEFYSALAHSARQLKQEKGSPEQMLKAMLKIGGKEAEIEWSGLREFMKTRGKSVTKTEIVEYLEANGVQVETVQLGGGTPIETVEQAQAILDDGGTLRGINGSGNSIGVMLDGDKELLPYVVEHWDRFDVYEGPVDGVPKYAGETTNVPGGDNYREVLLTLPPQTREETPEEIEARREEYRDREYNYYNIGRNDDGSYEAMTMAGKGIGTASTPFEAQALIYRDIDKAFDEHFVEPMALNVSERYTSGHYSDTPNVLAHIRMDDRVDADGKKVLFIQEIQSDWHQAGKKAGYNNPQRAQDLAEEIQSLDDEFDAKRAEAYSAVESMDFIGFDSASDAMFTIKDSPDSWVSAERKAKYPNEVAAIEEWKTAALKMDSLQEQAQDARTDGVPDAPFKGNAWVELSAKKVMRIAAEGGYDRVAWTTGEQQADRYNLRKKISLASASRLRNEGEYTLILEDLEGQEIAPYDRSGQRMTADEMEELVGKDLAQKLTEGAESVKDAPWPSSPGQSKNPAFFEIRGVDLEVGGEGLRTFYDSNLRNVFNKVGRRLDKKARVSVEGIAGGEDQLFSGAILFDDKWIDRGWVQDYINDLEKAGIPESKLENPSHDAGAVNFKKLTIKEYEDVSDLAETAGGRKVLYNINEGNFDGFDSQGLNVTPEMASSAKQGQPLFGEKKQADNFTPSRRSFLKKATQIALATAASGGYIRSTGVSGADLGKAKPVSMEDINTPLSAETIKHLENNDLVAAIAEVAKTGPASMRSIAKQIAGLMPAKDMDVLIDRKATPNAHGVVIQGQEGGATLFLYTAGNRTGLDYGTFVHESLHAVVMARYTSLNRGGANNYRVLKMEQPQARESIDNFISLYHEFKTAFSGSDVPSVQFALADPDELFVRALTDPDLQAALASKEYDGRTFWERFKDWVKFDLFAFKRTGTIPSWLDAALLGANDFIGAMEGDKADFAYADAMIKEIKANKAKREAKYSRRSKPGLDTIPEEAKPTVLKGGFGIPHPMADLTSRIKEVRHRIGTKLHQGLVDQYRSFNDILDNKQAWMLAHLSKSSAGVIEAVIEFGRPKLDVSGAIDVDVELPGLKDVLTPLGEELDRWTYWIAGNRADRLMGEDRENLFDENDIRILKNLNRNDETNPDRAALYESVRQEFEALGASIVQIAVDTGIVNEDEAENWKEEGFYLPFYRVMDEDTSSQGPRMGSHQLVRQQAYKKLKGGRQKLGDLLGNQIMNWHHLIQASLNNQAASKALDTAVDLDIASEVPRGRPHSKKATYIRRDGQEVWYEVDQTTEGKLILESLTMLNNQGLNGIVMQAARSFKRALTIGVTASPEFKIRNLFRDTIQAIAVADMSTNIAKNLYQGAKATGKNSESRARMLASGATFGDSGYIHGSDPEAIRHVLTKSARNTILTDTHLMRKMWDKWQDFGARLENVNRAANFVQAEDADKDLLTAAFESRDHLDFTRTGSFVAIRGIAQVVPFLNARLQGLDKLARAAKDRNQRGQFGAVVTTYAALSVALYLMMKDDDDYKETEEWMKDTYHLFKIPGGDGTMYKIPRPFEVGAIATIAERFTEQWVDDEVHGKLFADRLLHTLGETFSFNPMPQIFKPAAEVAMDKNWFTGSPIEGLSLRNLSPEKRKKAWTSQTAIAASEGMNAITWGKVVLSPVQIQHLVRGYLGWLGSTALAGADMITREATGAPDAPDWKVPDYPVLKAFVARDPARSTKYTTLFYERLGDLQEMQADINQAKTQNDEEEWVKLMTEAGEKIKLRRFYNKKAKELSKINARLGEIYRSDLSGRVKTLEIDRLTRQKNHITQYVNDETEQLF